MDRAMFMAFAMDEDEKNMRIQNCIEDIANGAEVEVALIHWDLEYEDIEGELRYSL